MLGYSRSGAGCASSSTGSAGSSGGSSAGTAGTSFLYRKLDKLMGVQKLCVDQERYDLYWIEGLLVKRIENYIRLLDPTYPNSFMNAAANTNGKLFKNPLEVVTFAFINVSIVCLR